jgi:selenocysteine lyase/cysteine desulfurase
MFSTANFNDWVYFRTSLQLLEEVGYPHVMARLYELADHLCTGLRDLGFHVLSDRFPGENTAIVVAEHPEHPAGVLVNQLRHEGVIAAERLGRVRFSPHVYLLKEHLDHAIEAISRALS